MTDDAHFDFGFRPATYWPAGDHDDDDVVRRLLAGIPGMDDLPSLEAAEATIATIFLRSTMGDYIELRARREAGLISYRIVDEYDTLYRHHYALARTISAQPLTLAELIDLLDGTTVHVSDGGSFRGLVQAFRRDGLPASRYRDTRREAGRFVSISSAFYPQLSDYYEADRVTWVTIDVERPVVAERSRTLKFTQHGFEES